jgi:hypothetical protein
MPEERQPCPFCKSGEMSICFTEEQEAYVCCWLCYAAGPRAETENAAWSRWNQRWVPTEGE